jgi:Cu2+-exporting ATPase
VRQNLAWAFAYNLIALPAAAGVLEPWLGFAIPPGGAGAVMAASSVLVVANSLRLRAVRLD